MGGGSGDEEVVAVAAEQLVAARAADEEIAAVRAVEQVIAGLADVAGLAQTRSRRRGPR